MQLKTFLVLFLCALVVACNKKNEKLTGTRVCIDTELHPYFWQYSYDSVATVIARVYFKDSLFDQLIDERTLKTDSVTGSGQHNILFSLNMKDSFDYELILPLPGDTFRISQITMDPRSETYEYNNGDRNPGPVFCLNYFHSDEMKVTWNGQPAKANFSGLSPYNHTLVAFTK